MTTPAAGPDAAPDSPALAYGDSGMILRTLIANQRRLIAALRCLAVPSGYPVSTATVNNHLDAALGQIETMEAVFAQRLLAVPDAPDDNGTGVIDPPAWTGRPVAPAWRHALDPIETSGEAAGAVPDGTGAAEEGTRWRLSSWRLTGQESVSTTRPTSITRPPGRSRKRSANPWTTTPSAAVCQGGARLVAPDSSAIAARSNGSGSDVVPTPYPKPPSPIRRSRERGTRRNIAYGPPQWP